MVNTIKSHKGLQCDKSQLFFQCLDIKAHSNIINEGANKFQKGPNILSAPHIIDSESGFIINFLV